MRKVRHVSLAFAAFLSAATLLFVQCTPPGIGSSEPSRTVHFRIVVSPDFASNLLWRKNIENLMHITGDFYKSLAEMTFIVDTMYSWDIKQSSSYKSVSDAVCLMKEVPKGSSDVVLYITKESSGNRSWPLLGFSQIRFGYLSVFQMGWLEDKNEGYLIAYHTMVHELGHMFGAVHCYPVKNNLDYMNPVVSGELIQHEGKSVEYQEPTFHENNMRIVQSLGDRPFSFRDSTGTPLANVVRVYRQLHMDSNPWRIVHGGLANYEFDAFYEEDPYYFLATWASLWGKDTLAMGYLDSMEILWKTMSSTCASGLGSGSGKICSRMMRPDGKDYETLALLHAYLLFEKALVQLGAGKSDEAQACIDSFMTCQTAISAGDRTLVLNDYAFYKEYYSSISKRDITEPAGIDPVVPDSE